MNQMMYKILASYEEVILSVDKSRRPFFKNTSMKLTADRHFAVTDRVSVTPQSQLGVSLFRVPISLAMNTTLHEECPGLQ
jgi:hypothetical protein